MYNREKKHVRISKASLFKLEDETAVEYTFCINKYL